MVNKTALKISIKPLRIQEYENRTRQLLPLGYEYS